jgi:hypothetical protein
MTWSYSGDPSDSDKDSVRFIVGDTDTTDQLVTDEEIAWALTQNSNIYGASAIIAGTIAAKFSRKVDKSVGDLKLSLSQKSKQYLQLQKDLNGKTATRVIPFSGGISIANKDSYKDDTDRVRPAFNIDMQQDPDLTSRDRELTSSELP